MNRFSFLHPNQPAPPSSFLPSSTNDPITSQPGRFMPPAAPRDAHSDVHTRIEVRFANPAFHPQHAQLNSLAGAVQQPTAFWNNVAMPGAHAHDSGQSAWLTPSDFSYPRTHPNQATQTHYGGVMHLASDYSSPMSLNPGSSHYPSPVISNSLGGDSPAQFGNLSGPGTSSLYDTLPEKERAELIARMEGKPTEKIKRMEAINSAKNSYWFQNSQAAPKSRDNYTPAIRSLIPGRQKKVDVLSALLSRTGSAKQNSQMFYCELPYEHECRKEGWRKHSDALAHVHQSFVSCRYTCIEYHGGEFCGKGWPTLARLNEHIRKMEGPLDIRVPCPSCYKEITERNLNRHRLHFNH